MATTPAYKTLGFWMTLILTNASLLLVSGIVLPGTVSQIVGWVVAVATSLGYKALKPAE